MELQQSWQDRFYIAVAKKSPSVIPLFKYLYLVILFISVGLGTYFEKSVGPYFQTFYDLGRTMGQAAIILLGIVVLPGILGRFGIEIRITRIITVFRRQLGILVFILAFSHFYLVRFMPWVTGLFPFWTVWQLFEYLGAAALSLLFVMFLTSNNYSMRTLGRWWKRTHRIVYVVLWLLVLHTGLQRISIWSVFIFIFAALEVASLLYARFKSKSQPEQLKS
ncbi:MAG: ferric reductase-like transmembrane domain-containing protein [Candidatus Curtissbacteria bacterium]|nr:ferric reductase-like transmembrane domain-containing protein [Candidatus Curtissbacteria bacterium]